MKKRIETFLAFGVLLLMLAAGVACGHPDGSDNKQVTAENTVAPDATPQLIRPRGDELAIKVRKKSREKYSITVTNISDDEIFCPYIPGRGTNLAQYFPYGTEKRIPGSENFETIDTWGHYAPGIHPIKPNVSVAFSFYWYEKGEYRVTFSCLNDKEIARFLMERKSRDLGNMESQRILDSYREFVTPIMTID